MRTASVRLARSAATVCAEPETAASQRIALQVSCVSETVAVSVQMMLHAGMEKFVVREPALKVIVVMSLTAWVIPVEEPVTSTGALHVQRTLNAVSVWHAAIMGHAVFKAVVPDTGLILLMCKSTEELRKEGAGCPLTK